VDRVLQRRAEAHQPAAVSKQGPELALLAVRDPDRRYEVGGQQPDQDFSINLVGLDAGFRDGPGPQRIGQEDFGSRLGSYTQ